MLQKHFHFNKKELVMSGERAVLYELCKLVPELQDNAAFDFPVPVLFGKHKKLEWKKPDYLKILYSGYLHIEYDECVNHEDDEERLVEIHSQTQTPFGYVIRICEQRGTKEALCKRHATSDFAYYKLKRDEKTNRKIGDVVEIIRQRLEWLKQGLEPNEERVWKTRLFF
jgi:hypothetical protein